LTKFFGELKQLNLECKSDVFLVGRIDKKEFLSGGYGLQRRLKSNWFAEISYPVAWKPLRMHTVSFFGLPLERTKGIEKSLRKHPGWTWYHDENIEKLIRQHIVKPDWDCLYKEGNEPLLLSVSTETPEKKVRSIRIGKYGRRQNKEFTS
jgi:hypothetical protein